MESEELLQQSNALARRQAQLEGTRNQPARMQPGEDPHNPTLEDALHWESVYAELVEFKRGLLDEVEAKIRSSSKNGVASELSHDLALLSVELQRLVLHHAFWRERAPADGDRQ